MISQWAKQAPAAPAVTEYERQVPGGQYVNQSSTDTAQIPGGPYLNDQMIRLLLILCLAIALPADARKAKRPKPVPVPVCSEFGWCSMGLIKNVPEDPYMPWTVIGPNAILMMNNNAGQWTQRRGTFTEVGGSSVALPYTAIYDEGPATYRVRTSAVQHLSTGGCVGMLTVGNGYPSTDSYRPAWATSDDCVNWIYRGRLLIDGSFTGYVRPIPARWWSTKTHRRRRITSIRARIGIWCT